MSSGRGVCLYIKDNLEVIERYTDGEKANDFGTVYVPDSRGNSCLTTILTALPPSSPSGRKPEGRIND